MKKIVFLFVLGFTLGFVRCDIDCGPFPTPELERVDAALSTANGGGVTPLASDLRLDLSLDVRYIVHRPATFSLFQRAMACSPAPPSGFGDEILLLSLTCDRPIRGFAAGKNILTTSADVFRIRQDSTSEASITLGQWLELMNKGETTSLGHRYSDYYEWLDAYDVSIAFIPEGTDVAAGEYNFTFTLELQKGSRYVIKSMTVTL